MEIFYKQHNARHSTPREVAATFVPPSFFEDLLEPKNNLLIGPRGSGKTTLLKMVTVPALEAWEHPGAEEYRRKVGYTAVYVPSDITWREQFFALEDELKDKPTSERFARAAFTCHFYRAFLAALMSRLERYMDQRELGKAYRRKGISIQQEDEVCRRLAAYWMLPEPAPTLPILREMLSARIEEIHRIVEAERISGADGRDKRLVSIEWLRQSYLYAIPTILDIVNRVLDEPDAQWALLFDELEIAPEWLQRELYSTLHSTDQRVLLKLAMAPYMPFMPAVPDAKPVGRQDYIPIYLWGQSRKHTLEFCNAIWAQLIQAKQLPSSSPVDMLGVSLLGGEELSEDQPRKYEEGSVFATAVRELMSKDQSFTQYLERNKATPSHWRGLGEERRAQILRKAYPVVYLRNYYLKEGGVSTRKRRSRKAHSLFAGYPAAFVVTEGNPRLFKGVLSALIDAWNQQGRKIDAAVQGRILRDAAEVFKSTLSTAVAPQPSVGRWGTGIVPLLECIGDRFRERVYGVRFDPDPKATFVVDDRTPDDIAKAVGVALNLGGVIEVTKESDEAFGDVYGKRFRLCYLLGLLKGLPFRLGPMLHLSEIVSSQESLEYSPESIELEFDEDEGIND